MPTAIPEPPRAFADLIRSWARSLRAAGKSDRTLDTYTESATLFANFVTSLDERREELAELFSDDLMGELTSVTDVVEVSRGHIELFIAHLHATQADSTAHNRYRGVKQWFKWLAAEEEIERNLMADMSPPAMGEKLVPVVPMDDLKALLKTCAGKDFAARRDEAIIRLLLDAGPVWRRSPASTLKTWIWTSTSCGCEARATGNALFPSERRRALRWTVIYGCGDATSARTTPRCGSLRGRPAGSPTGGFLRCWSAAVRRPRSTRSILTSYVTLLPTSGRRPGARTRT